MAIPKNAPRKVHCGICGGNVTISPCSCRRLTVDELISRNQQRVSNFRQSVKEGFWLEDEVVGVSERWVDE